jgi:hypothetical protein
MKLTFIEDEFKLREARPKDFEICYVKKNSHFIRIHKTYIVKLIILKQSIWVTL